MTNKQKKKQIGKVDKFPQNFSSFFSFFFDLSKKMEDSTKDISTFGIEEGNKKQNKIWSELGVSQWLINSCKELNINCDDLIKTLNAQHFYDRMSEDIKINFKNINLLHSLAPSSVPKGVA